MKGATMTHNTLLEAQVVNSFKGKKFRSHITSPFHLTTLKVLATALYIATIQLIYLDISCEKCLETIYSAKVIFEQYT